MKKTLFILAIALCGVSVLFAQKPMRGFVSGGATSTLVDASFGAPIAGTAGDEYTLTHSMPFSQVDEYNYKDTVLGGTDFVDDYFSFTPATIEDGGLHHKYVTNGADKKYDLKVNLDLYVIPCGPGDTILIGEDKYATVPVANRCWTKRNLRLNVDGSRVYGDKTVESYIDTFGRLYTWNAAVANNPTPDAETGFVKGICPEGWHIPTVGERAKLDAIDVATLNHTTLWQGTHEPYTNTTGFTAVPAGIYNTALDRYEGFGTQTDWWTDNNGVANSQISVIEINYFCDKAMDKTQDANNAISVRCVKNEFVKKND